MYLDCEEVYGKCCIQDRVDKIKQPIHEMFAKNVPKYRTFYIFRRFDSVFALDYIDVRGVRIPKERIR